MRSPASLKGAFFWLSAFYVVYCARPEDWIKVLGYIPLAKITSVLALLGLLASLGRTRRKIRDLPRESNYLLAMIGVLFVSALLSPVWKGGALNRTLDFAKVYIVWVLTFLLVTDYGRLRRIIYIQSASVAVISAVSIIMGHSRPRLEGVLGGIYSNPNDLAFAIVLTLPFCLAFLLTAKGAVTKLCWIAAMLIMALALFMTASRAGFITLVISGTVCLWHFGVKGRRFYLIAVSGLTVVLLLVVAGGPLMSRMTAITGNTDTQMGAVAYESYEARKYLMNRAVEGIEHYPILGLGVRNFQVYSGVWHDVHMTYLQIAVEGGIPSLILYLLFFASAFRNLRQLRRRQDLDVHTTLFVGGLHSSMIGFVVGALFAPEAYQFFPYFSVAYTSALVAMIAEREPAPEPSLAGRDWRSRYGIVRDSKRKSGDFTLAR
ncbi:MAG: O-antigen ligase family protein [Candidatus Sulfotelmatobacter sp.]